MTARPGRLAALAAAALLGLAACSDDGRDVGGGNTTTGAAVPAAASAETVAAAAIELADATSFRFEGTAQQTDPAGATVAQRVEATFQAPGTLHLRRLALDGSLQLEQWFTPEKVFVREPPQPDGRQSPVRCASPEAVAGADPRRLLREVAKIERAEPSEKGGSTFELPPEAARVAFGPPADGEYTKVSGRATVVGSVLGILHVEATIGEVALQADFLYADVGSAPPIEVPAADC